MKTDLELVKQLRAKTGAGVLESQSALAEAKGDLDRAVAILRLKGQAKAVKRQDRTTSEGTIGVYIHSGNQVAALVELHCETDFVARTDDFKNLAHDLAMQVAATNPLYLSPQDIPAEEVDKERAIAHGSMPKGKPASVSERIVGGKLEKFFSEVCLLKQVFIKDETRTIEQLLNDSLIKLGENIQIRRFIRFQL